MPSLESRLSGSNSSVLNFSLLPAKRCLWGDGSISDADSLKVVALASPLKQNGGCEVIQKFACAMFVMTISIGYVLAEEQETEKSEKGTHPVTNSGTGSALSVKEADDFVKYHNRVRTEVGSPPVKWSSTLARFAQQWANHIAETGEITHRPSDGEWAQKYGENWAIGTGDFDALSAAAFWEDEKTVLHSRDGDSRPGKFRKL